MDQEYCAWTKNAISVESLRLVCLNLGETLSGKLYTALGVLSR